MATSSQTPLTKDTEKGASVYTFEEAFAKAGNNNYFQYRIIFILCYQRIFYGFLLMGFPYFFMLPNFECRRSDSDPWEMCMATPENCKYDIRVQPGSNHSLVTDFDLYCSKSGMPAFIESLFMISNVVGLFLISPVSDIFGRKPGLIFCVILSIVGISVATLSSSIEMFLGLFFVCGLGIGPYVPATYLLVNESTSDKLGQSGSAMMNATRCSGQLIVGIMAAFIHNNWREYMIFYIAVPFLISLPMMFSWMVETPKYLLSKLKFEQARKILVNKIAKVNKKEINQNFKFPEELQKRISLDKEIVINGPESEHESESSTIQNLEDGSKSMQYNYLTLFKFKSLRKLTIVISLLFFLDNGLWFGLIFGVQYMRVSTEYMTTALSIAEGLSCILGVYIFSRVKRRKFFIWTHVFQAIALLGTYFCEIPMDCSMDTPNCWQQWAQLFSACLCRFLCTLITILYFIYTNEAYPTRVRSIGGGFSSICSRVGSALVPIFAHFATQNGYVVLFMYGVAVVPAIPLCFLLKETKGNPAGDFIEEEVDILGIDTDEIYDQSRSRNNTKGRSFQIHQFNDDRSSFGFNGNQEEDAKKYLEEMGVIEEEIENDMSMTRDTLENLETGSITISKDDYHKFD